MAGCDSGERRLTSKEFAVSLAHLRHFDGIFSKGRALSHYIV
jgi:hypothetical protein